MSLDIPVSLSGLALIALKRPQVAYGVGARQQVLIWKLDNCPFNTYSS